MGSMILPENLHVADRVGRLALGVAMMVMGWQGETETWALVLRVFAFYPLLTGIAGWCPVYALLRFRTRR